MRPGLLFVGLGILAYLAPSLLTGWFIERAAPGLLDLSRQLPPDADGELLWEKTAGQGIVPKWVSLVGMTSLPLLLWGLVLILWNAWG